LPLSQVEYENEIAKAEEQVRQYQARQPQATIDVKSLKYSPDVEIIGKGKSVFMNNNCGSCHRVDGGGNAIGPNLTDVYWIHGGNIKNIFNTVQNGVVDKGMPAWGRSLSPTEVRDVAFYILSLQGTNPAGAKAPQGELFKTEMTTSDSTKVQASL
jgi:cytochrome c oxidase cbb3-type subunit 3